MSYLIISLVAALASLLTLYSGFGLGTLLLPAFAIFFPAEVAIGLTAIVHLFNNLFKLSLLGRKASKQLILKFGIPSLIGAVIGAILLMYLSDMQYLYTYNIIGIEAKVGVFKIILALLMIFFALMEIIPYLKKLTFSEKYLGWGGLLSGFFGGLSGHQGALRSAFLIRLNLPKEVFISTGVLIACMIDVTRLSLYWNKFSNAQIYDNYPLLIAATLSAFLGVYIGSKLIDKVTLPAIQKIVAIMLFIIAFLLLLGII